MARATTPIPLDQFTTFGELLRYLRLRAGLSQLELSIAVGCSGAYISRLEKNRRLPNLPTFFARFVPALGLADQPATVARLRALAAPERPEPSPAVSNKLPMSLTRFIGREREIADVSGWLARARAQLSEAAFAAEWAAGQKLTLDQAIELALTTVGEHLSMV